MKKPAIARLLALIGLCALAVPIMGGGTACPKLCVVEGAACEASCNSGMNGVCIRQGSVLNCRLTNPAPENGGGSDSDGGCSTTPGVMSSDAAASWLVPILLLGVVALRRRWLSRRHE